MISLIDTSAWQSLERVAAGLRPGAIGEPSRNLMRHWFEQDPRRFERLSLDAGGLFFDFSKQRLNQCALDGLLALARERGVAEGIVRMFAGEKVNSTEGRAALHVALRAQGGRRFQDNGEDITDSIAEARVALRRVCDEVAASARTGTRTGRGAVPIRDVVSIGIGGSDLGPRLLCEALAPHGRGNVAVHFVANVDGAALDDCLRTLDPTSTLFVVVSKTFTTLETLTNALHARRWLIDALGEEADIGAHFLTVSTRPRPDERFAAADGRDGLVFWDWVGGRYSAWSAAGVAAALYLGHAGFDAFLAGGAEMDQHFETAPLERNAPVLAGLIGVWNSNLLGFATQAVVPYDERLARLPAYLQQLEMESNGKSVDDQGQRVRWSTAPVVWGDRGTDGQHAFFQQLHQGPLAAPVDFIAAANHGPPMHPSRPGLGEAEAHDHHDLLLANCLAQSRALMVGRTPAEAEAQALARGVAGEQASALAPHRAFAGDRPSTTILMRDLAPRNLGRLLAFYEHKVYVQGLIWGINSFDQWGVELGKELAGELYPSVTAGDVPESADASTAGLLRRLAAWRGTTR